MERARAAPTGMFAVVGRIGARIVGGSRTATVLRFRDGLNDGRDYKVNRSARETNRSRDYDLNRLDLEALVTVAWGEVQLVPVDRANDSLVGLCLRKELDAMLVLVGVAEVWIVADGIAAAGVTGAFASFDTRAITSEVARACEK